MDVQQLSEGWTCIDEFGEHEDHEHCQSIYAYMTAPAFLEPMDYGSRWGDGTYYNESDYQ